MTALFDMSGSIVDVLTLTWLSRSMTPATSWATATIVTWASVPGSTVPRSHVTVNPVAGHDPPPDVAELRLSPARQLAHELRVGRADRVRRCER